MNSIQQRNMQNKTAIITGSGRGIGKETAIQLAEHVANIVVCSRTQDEIDSVLKEIEANNNQVNVLGLRCDVSVSSDVSSLEYGSTMLALAKDLLDRNYVLIDKRFEKLLIALRTANASE
ncbi:MAG: SDR family NAD(P)-dependent oxidoreductase [Nitrososphaeraceae archaeon]